MGQDVFKSGGEAKGALGIGTDGNIMGEMMNLIAFYKENDVIEKTQTGTKKVEKTVDGETVTEEEPVYDNHYPVTALDISAVEEDMADALYRQFVVSGFSAEGSQQARYENEAGTFGGILGLSKAKMESTSGDIGSMVYENYIKNSLKSKESLDQQDMMFLANIQQKLNLSGEKGAELMQEAQKKILLDQGDYIFSDPKPEMIKAYREKCNGMGMEMQEDVGIPMERLEFMFVVEIEAAIEAGEITPESAELLTEIQESLGLSSDDCERVMVGIVERKTQSGLSKIRGEILRGREENCIPEIKQVLKYSSFAGGEVDGVKVDEETANKIFNIYDSMDTSDENIDEINKNKEVLKITVGLA